MKLRSIIFTLTICLSSISFAYETGSVSINAKNGRCGHHIEQNATYNLQILNDTAKPKIHHIEYTLCSDALFSSPVCIKQYEDIFLNPGEAYNKSRSISASLILGDVKSNHHPLISANIFDLERIDNPGKYISRNYVTEHCDHS